MKKTLLFLISGNLFLAFLVGIPQDALQALTGTGTGDHIRYFKYLQTARHKSVPAALIEHGVKP